MSLSFKNMFKFPFHFRANDVHKKHSFYQTYINDVELKLHQAELELKDTYDAAIETAVSEEHEDSIQSAFEDLWTENKETMPSLLYGSIFLSLYGFFEGTLKKCYDNCIVEWGFGYPPISKKNIAVHEYIGFFNKHMLYSFAKNKEDLKFINDCGTIRDKLIHTNGEMTKEEMNSIQDILSKHSSIKIKPNSFSIVDKKIVVKLNDKISEILQPFCMHLYKTIKEYTPITHDKS